MELLKKTIKYDKEKEKDNSDKKELLIKEHHPLKAEQYREEWFFIEYEPARDNISYHLQYLEYMVILYNEYAMYLTVESLHCKSMLVTLASVMECALYDLLDQLNRKKLDSVVDIQEDFSNLIDLGFRHGLLDGNMQSLLHELRKVRNFVHISNLENKEYKAYDIDQVNQYITLLNNFQKRIKEKYSKMIK